VVVGIGVVVVAIASVVVIAGLVESVGEPMGVVVDGVLVLDDVPVCRETIPGLSTLPPIPGVLQVGGA